MNKYYKYFKDILGFRHFIIGSIFRNFSLKYQDSVLGFAWALFNPLIYIVLYIIVFSTFMLKTQNDSLPNYHYGIYIFSGMLSWNLSVDILINSIGMLNQYSNLIKKTAFLKITLPIIVVGNSLINFILMLLILLVYVAIIQPDFNFILLCYLIPLLIVQSIFYIGIGVTLSIFNVFVRDISHLIQILLQILFWLTPIVYFQESAPGYLKSISNLNPMTYFVESYHSVFFYGKKPIILNLIVLFGIGIVLCILSFYLFNKFFSEIMDEL